MAACLFVPVVPHPCDFSYSQLLTDLPLNFVPHLKLGIFHFMFFNVAKLPVLADGYSMSYAA
jgi:hypothetical protein